MTLSLAEVLGIAPENDKPNAYELFGLAAGESDPERIQQAIDGTVRQLKSKQAETDATVWKQAASAVSKARKLLIDPQSKAAYDAKLRRRAAGRSGADQSAVARGGEAAVDPLRGLLPDVDPFAPFDVDAAAARAAGSKPYQPPPLPASSPPAPPQIAPPPAPPQIAPPRVETPPPAFVPDELLPAEEPPAEPSAAISSDALPFTVADDPSTGTARPRRRRRRSSPLLLIAFALLMLGMLVGIGMGIYTLAQRSGSGGAVAAAQGNAAKPAARPRPPASRPRANRPADPVMGNVGRETRPRDLDSLPPLTADVNMPLPTALPANDDAQGNGMQDSMQDGDNMQSDAANPDGDGDAAMMETPTAPTTEQLQAGEAALAAATQAIQSRQWNQMKAAAEAAQQAAADEGQRAAADALFEVADLADYYYHGIVKAINDLPSGNTFTLTEDIEVAVVEASPERLVLQVQGRSKTFPFDEMPFILVHRLGSFTMDTQDPSVAAAKAIFQYLAPQAQAGDRAEALQWLEELPEPSAENDPQRIAETLQRLLPTAS